MFCTKCGYKFELDVDTQFCPNCGKEIKRVQVKDAAPSLHREEVISKSAARGRKLWLPVAGSIVFIVAVVAGTVFFVKPYLSGDKMDDNAESNVEGNVEGPSVVDSIVDNVGSIGEDTDEECAPLYAHYDKNDTAHILLMDGRYITIENAKWAAVAPDREHVLVIGSTGERYITDIDLKTKTVIDEKSGSFDVYDGAAIFNNKDTNYLCRYDSGTLIKLCDGALEEFAISEEGGNILYGTGGSIYILTKDADEPVKKSSYENNWKPLYISNDGKKAYWAERSKKEAVGAYDICELKENEKNVITTYNAKSFPELILNADSSCAILGTGNEDKFIIIDKEGNATKAGMKNPIIFSRDRIFTSSTLFSEDGFSDFSGLYIATEGEKEDLYNIYYVDKNGDREALLSGLTKRTGTSSPQWSIYDKRLFYFDDGELHCAEIDGANVKNDKTIAGDVNDIICDQKGYVYYLKGNDDDCTAYVCKQGDEAIKICSEIKGRLWNNFYCSPDGKAFYFYKDTDTMYKYIYGEESPEKISNSVERSYLKDGYNHTYNSKNILNDKFTFFKAVDKNLYQWIYYNGKEIKSVAELEDFHYADYSWSEDDYEDKPANTEETETYNSNEDWIYAYQQLLRNPDWGFSDPSFSYSLIYVDDDEIPEIVIDMGSMDMHRIATYKDGEIIILKEEDSYPIYSIGYMERSGILYSNGGFSGFYPFCIYKLENGSFKLVAYGHESEMPDGNGDVTTEYYVGDNEKVSKKEYDAKIEQYIDSKKLKYPENYYSMDEMIQMLDGLY